MPHNFHDDLAYSEQGGEEPFWLAVYEKAFIGFDRMEQVFGDRTGTDRKVFLSNGDTVRIDEKKRRSVYSDILLEHTSNSMTETLGWVEKDLNIDYLAYAFMPKQRVYLFPWLMLRRAWNHYGDAWKEDYNMVIAENEGYATFSVAVPISVLAKSVKDAAIIQL